MIELTEGLLEGACCYLSGPMEFVADHGVEWRRKFIKMAHERGLKIDFIDPTDKPGDEEQKIGEDKGYQTSLKKARNWTALRDYVQDYRRLDLRFVDLSDFLVVVVDPRVPQWGTSNEVYFAEMQHKPMFFICDGGLDNLPNWLFDVIDLPDALKDRRLNVFGSVEEVVDELIGYDTGAFKMSKKWVLIRRKLELARKYRGDCDASTLAELRKIAGVRSNADLVTKIDEILNDA